MALPAARPALARMTPLEAFILGSYFFILSVLAVYGWHRYFLVYLYTKHRDHRPRPAGRFAELPRVTVQLPIFNELYVAERLIEAVGRLEYPKALLEIQVLDDSTDETRSLVESAARRLAARGFEVTYHHRSDRRGYKAGALAEGLKVARGEFIAIFDADFIPPPEFLQRTIPYFTDPQVGMVQARWGHVNQDYSLLTKVQAILLDGHFVLEHGARNRAGCFFNFNGTAGVWRRAAIESAGGWHHDTLTEDLDLSYRAQLRGWRFVFLPDLVAPAEVPVEMNGFKSQQHRWAKGSIQTCRKLLPRILDADLPTVVKAEAFFHLTANFNYPLMTVLSLLMFPAMYIRYTSGWTEMLLIDVPFFVAATASVGYFYTVSQREVYPDWRARIKYLPLLMAVGIGLSINNTRAVLEALFNRESPFARTPKYGVERSGDDWMTKKYRQLVVAQPLVELAIGLYFTGAVVYAAANGIYASLPFLVLFQAGYLYMGLVSILQQYGSDVVLRDAPALWSK